MDKSENKDFELFKNAIDNMPDDIFRAKFDGGKVKTAPQRKTNKDTPFDHEIDLHGFTQKEALSILKTALTRAKGKRQKLLIITGRGKNSVDGHGVIREAVMRFFDKGGKLFIQNYRFADRKHGGDGAFEVLTK